MSTTIARNERLSGVGEDAGGRPVRASCLTSPRAAASVCLAVCLGGTEFAEGLVAQGELEAARLVIVAAQDLAARLPDD